LIAEWVAREISRFLNQMRKTADFAIDARVNCWYVTDSTYLKWILEQFGDFLSEEALIVTWSNDLIVWSNVQEIFENEWEVVTFSLKS
jgi:hypothetical protein